MRWSSSAKSLPTVYCSKRWHLHSVFFLAKPLPPEDSSKRSPAKEVCFGTPFAPVKWTFQGVQRDYYAFLHGSIRSLKQLFIAYLFLISHLPFDAYPTVCILFFLDLNPILFSHFSPQRSFDSSSTIFSELETTESNTDGFWFCLHRPSPQTCARISYPLMFCRSDPLGFLWRIIQPAVYTQEVLVLQTRCLLIPTRSFKCPPSTTCLPPRRLLGVCAHGMTRLQLISSVPGEANFHQFLCYK